MYKFTKRIRFNQLEEGDMFTFRKNGEIRYEEDVLMRMNCFDSYGFECNVLQTISGGIDHIYNPHRYVWKE